MQGHRAQLVPLGFYISDSMAFEMFFNDRVIVRTAQIAFHRPFYTLKWDFSA